MKGKQLIFMALGVIVLSALGLCGLSAVSRADGGDANTHATNESRSMKSCRRKGLSTRPDRSISRFDRVGAWPTC